MRYLWGNRYQARLARRPLLTQSVTTAVCLPLSSFDFLLFGVVWDGVRWGGGLRGKWGEQYTIHNGWIQTEDECFE